MNYSRWEARWVGGARFWHLILARQVQALDADGSHLIVQCRCGAAREQIGCPGGAEAVMVLLETLLADGWERSARGGFLLCPACTARLEIEITAGGRRIWPPEPR